MKRLLLILAILGYTLFSYSQRYTGYGRGIDEDSGLFFVTGDDAVSGVFMLLGSIAIAFICSKAAEIIDKNEESEGIRHTVSMILYSIACIAIIAAIAFAYALWWIMLILFGIFIIGLLIHDKIENNIEVNHKTKEKEEANSPIPQIKQNENNYPHSNNENYNAPDGVKIENKETVFIKSWKLLSFVKEFKLKMQIGSFINKSDNTKFKMCIFTDINGTKTYVDFFPELGELSPQEIKNRKEELYIGKEEKGNYFLYSTNNKGWKIKEETSTTSLSSFITIHGSISIEECVNNMDGDYNKLCMFTNIHGDKTFAAFSPYLGELTLEDIEKEKYELYINKREEGCYFLCTKETEEYRKENEDEFCYFSAEYELEKLLTTLNVKHDFENYTFSFEASEEE